MFNDGRSKKVVFVAHCILNQNSISDGTANFPAADIKAIKLFFDNDIGIVQMPCPELLCLGLDRGNVYGGQNEVVVENTRIRKEMLKPSSESKLDILVEQVVEQIEQYLKHGFQVVGVIGMNRSPCCGVDTTSNMNEEIKGEGVYISRIKEKLQKAGIIIPIRGIRSFNV